MITVYDIDELKQFLGKPNFKDLCLSYWIEFFKNKSSSPRLHGSRHSLLDYDGKFYEKLSETLKENGLPTKIEIHESFYFFVCDIVKDLGIKLETRISNISKRESVTFIYEPIRH